MSSSSVNTPPSTRPARQRPWSRWSIVFAYCLALAAATWNVERHREWNFDIVGYVAAVLASEEPDPLFLHIRTYGAVAEAAGQGVYEEFAGGTRFRREIGTSPAALLTQIPFYSSKPGYVWALRLMSSSDQGIVDAAHRLSIAAYVAIGVLAFSWISRLVPLPSAALLSLLLVLSPPFATTARISTPDMLSAAILVFASYLAIELELVWAGGLVFALACAVRSDSILAVFAVLGWVALTRSAGNPRVRSAALVGVVLSAVAAAFAASRGYPWGVVLKHTFHDRLFEPARMSERISVNAYFRALFAGFARKNSLDWTVVPLEALISLLVFTVAMRGRLAWNSWVGMLAVAWIVLVAHYLTFPMMVDRFFLESYFLITVAAAGIVGGRAAPGFSHREAT
jgi:hypothetical protein